eukprot:15367004-Ditylum_brightwellii.AAC.2
MAKSLLYQACGHSIVNLVCATEDAKTEKYWCFKCTLKAAAMIASKSESKNACKVCSGIDHKRKSAHLCRYTSAKGTLSQAFFPSDNRENLKEGKSDDDKN